MRCVEHEVGRAHQIDVGTKAEIQHAPLKVTVHNKDYADPPSDVPGYTSFSYDSLLHHCNAIAT